MLTVITARHLITSAQCIDAPAVTLDGETILAVQPRSSMEMPEGAREISFPDLILAPGFIDIHIHGGAGHDVMEADDTALRRIEEQMARHGVTAYLPTTVTAPQ